MLLEELAALLAVNNLGVIGETIFLDSLPSRPDACFALYHYAGRPGRYRHDNLLPADDQPRVQVASRAKSYATARDRALTVHNLLHFRHKQLGGTRYWRSEALQWPFKLKTDEDGREIFVFNLELHKMV